MKRIGFTGPATREKIFLMCYLAKVLAVDSRVMVVPGCQWFGDGLDHYEFSESLTVSTVYDPYDQPDYLLEEAYPDMAAGYELVFGVVDLLVNMAVLGRDCFDGPGYKAADAYIFMNLIMDSSIGQSYLTKRLGLTETDQPALILYLDDGDICTSIENSYERRLDMKGLSKAYRRVLITLTEQITETPVKTARKWLKEAERG